MLHRRPAQTVLLAAVILATTLRVSLAQGPVGSAFTYQGRLTLSGQPVSGATDFFVMLWDGWAGGFPIGPSVELTNVPVTDGLFTVPLDFGADAFDGNARYLEIRVRHPAGLGSYQLLTPRQPVAPAPYAVMAQSLPGVGVDENQQVGMGTDAPATKLDIRAPTVPGKGQLTLVDPDEPSTAAAALAALTGFGSDINDGGDGRLWYMGSHSANNRDVLVQNSLSSGKLKLATGGRAADVVLDGAGNVGIGATAPATKLDIRAPIADGKGQLTLVDPDSASTATAVAALTGFGSDIGDGGDGRLWYMGSHSAGNKDVLIQNTLASGSLRLATEGRAADVVLDSSGFLGLGTTAPTSPLTFKNADERKITFFETAGSGYFGMDLAQGVLSTWTGLAGAFAVGQHAPDGTFTELMRVSGGGRVGIGTSTPLTRLHVEGSIHAAGTTADFSVPTAEAMEFGHRDPSTGAFTERMRFGAAGNVGIGTASPLASLDVKGGVQIDRNGWNSGDVKVKGASGQNVAWLTSRSGAPDMGWFGLYRAPGEFSVIASADETDGYGTIETFGPNGKSNVWIGRTFGDANAGAVTVRDANGQEQAGILVTTGGSGRVWGDYIELFGGSDIAEPFNVRGEEQIEPGMVVGIDPENPGELRLTTRAYDRTVAGVISGAGGVRPGMMLAQKGSIADGEHPVALTGRVYCYVDADAGGRVQPGDLLTTSDTPGHAMRVSDHPRASGAIIGKAMTALESGRGLVLVLVNLQ